MQALDTTIANVALPYIQGSVSASADQINWVLTSYIVGGRHHDAALRLSRQPVRPQARAADRDRRLRGRLDPVRHRAIAGRRSSASACCRACSAPRWCRCRRRILLDIYTPEERGSAMALFGVSVMVGPVLGPGDRRLADRQHQLALGVLHQPAASARSPSPASAPSSSRPRRDVARQARLARLRRAQPRHRGAADLPRPRRAARLVLLRRDHRSRRSSAASRLLHLPRPHVHGEAAPS